MAIPKYNHSKDLKITYFLGAGASCNSIPIWKGQGKTMISVANSILSLLKENQTIKTEFPILFQNEKLLDFFSSLRNFGKLATEYGSIDIYARRLYLIDEKNELNELKKCLSVYFDLWENFLHKEQMLSKPTGILSNDGKSYEKIDKRYFSLFSVLLEKGLIYPKLNDNISFLTWNYDLQLESSFESFLPRKSISLEDTNNYLNFMSTESNTGRNEVLHLNGFRGYFSEADKSFDTVERSNCTTIESYLTGFLENYKQFRDPDFNNSIKYAWESSSDSLKEAREIMSDTNILIIIGYSFPAFNRRIDTELIKAFEKGGGIKEVVYQDPFANQDIVNSIFTNPENVQLMKQNTGQFHIPHEFLFPTEPQDYYV